MVKNSPANAGDLRDEFSIPGSGRPLRGGNGNPFQYSYLEHPMDRGAWQATRGPKEYDVTENTHAFDYGISLFLHGRLEVAQA